jgi:hypothetical protein
MSAHVLLWTFGFVKDWKEGEYCWWQRMDTAVVGVRQGSVLGVDSWVDCRDCRL